jgi:hypothetical protein
MREATMRQREWRLAAAGLVAVCGLLASPGLSAQQGDPISPPSVTTLTSRILTISQATLTLRLEDADPEDLFAAGPALRALLALRAEGDIVRVTYYRSRVVGITVGGGGTLPAGVRPGQSPGILPLLIDVTVLAMDPDPSAPTITVLFGNGAQRTYEVLHPQLLTGFQVGDVLTLTISRPLLTDIELAQ